MENGQSNMDSPRYKAYGVRWYILIVYSLAGLCQGYLWNMWGPIYASVHAVYKWDITQMALFPFYGTILFALFVLPSALLLEKIGLRKTVVLMTGLNFLGTLVRCFPFGSTLSTTVLVNISAIINGLPGIVTFFIPAYISARWFPMKERKAATAIGTLLNTLGIAGSFLLGPAFVRTPSHNVTTEDINAMKWDYYHYTWFEGGICLILFILTVIYYPEKPPLPPSESAEVPRVDYLEGSKILFKSKSFWLAIAPVTFVFGTYSGWVPILPIDLKEKGVDEKEAGKIGFLTSIVGAAVGIFAGVIGDHVGNLKALLIACCALAVHSSIWLVLIMRGIIAFSLRQAYIASILLGTSCSALLPINFELAVEICYPVDEALVVGILGLVVNVWCSLFLTIVFFKSVGTLWIDWFLAASCIIGLITAFAIKARYRRTAVDMGTAKEAEESDSDSIAPVSADDEEPIIAINA